MRLHRTHLAAAALCGGISLFLACSAATGSSPGQLAVSLVDAPNPAVSEIWVHVTKVMAHSSASGWRLVSATPLDVDLLKLQSYAAPLGITSMPAGTVTQIRLVVAPDGNHVVTAAGDVPLKVPSGSESGIKIKGPWEITSCSKTTVTLDFDGNKSIWYHPTGQGDEWILRPVIRTRGTEHADVSCDPGPSDAGTDGGEPGGVTTCLSETRTCSTAGAGQPCQSGVECLSGTCDTNACTKSPAGGPCRQNADCASGACGGDGSCSSGNATGAGSACESATECLSGACVASVCGAGAQNTACNVAADCQSGVCTDHACGEPLSSAP
jgi:hypothetical protein